MGRPSRAAGRVDYAEGIEHSDESSLASSECESEEEDKNMEQSPRALRKPANVLKAVVGNSPRKIAKRTTARGNAGSVPPAARARKSEGAKKDRQKQRAGGWVDAGAEDMGAKSSSSGGDDMDSASEDEVSGVENAPEKKRGRAAAAKPAKPPAPRRRSTPKTSKGAASAATTGDRRGAAIAGEDLPVLREPQAMFDDIVRRTPDLATFVRALTRPLRVATMCSGTESPLLALGMLARACKERYGAELEVEHVFSCEIEPWKQAYIERNFSPPILFRDVCELGQDEATTAYGALVPVPGDVDMLVAGTSCVDYSTLNNAKKTIHADGQSGRTFRGMLAWVKRNRPPVVILENVCNAPWPTVQQEFEKVGYSTKHLRLDTKQYYIPHTRTRGYMMATLRSGDAISASKDGDERAELWREKVESLRRPSSSALEAFLLRTDDPRVHGAREVFAAPRSEKARPRTDWNKCESRHRRARAEEKLGTKRPLTQWEDGGMCKMPDHAWNNWGKAQPDRVLDLMDINYLRSARDGVDASYKTTVWNLSQNVDRSTGSSRPGICPCLTPTMVPYVTNRGGPVVGLEALSLQGIPVDDLLLTRETEDNMADLAGNAMTTTVVGSAMLAALLVNQGALIGRSTGAKKHKRDNEGAGEGADIEGDAGRPSSKPLGIATASVSGAALAADVCTVTGDEALEPRVLSLERDSDVSLPQLLEAADRSARKCACEGRDSLAADILLCKDCGHTACSKCSGHPEHNYARLEEDASADANKRLKPREFESMLALALPMRLQLTGLGEASLGKAKGSDQLDATEAQEDGASDEEEEKSLWSAWLASVSALDGAEFRFSAVERGEVWTAVYASANVFLPPSAASADGGSLSKVSAALGSAVAAPAAKLELVLDPLAPEWRLSVAAPAERGPLRDLLLSLPVARCPIDPSAVSPIDLPRGPKGANGWQVCLPERRVVELTVQGKGKLVDTWEAALGVVEAQGERRWTQLELSAPREAEAAGRLDGHVGGTYKLLARCGGAQSSLHKRVESTEAAAEASERPGREICLFLDPSRSGGKDEDGFVLARNPRRLAYGDQRGAIARFDMKWRPEVVKADDAAEEAKAATLQRVQCRLNGRWAPLVDGNLGAVSCGNASVATAAVKDKGTSSAHEQGADASCTVATAVLRCEASLSGGSGASNASNGMGSWPIQSCGRWDKVDVKRSRGTFEALAWLTRRLRIPEAIKQWQEGPGDPQQAAARCERCAPTRPTLLWALQPNGKKRVHEDYRDAGRYEQALKMRPEAFVVQLRRDGDVGKVRIAVNVESLAHRAVVQLQQRWAEPADDSSALSYTWRVMEHSERSEPLPALQLSSNREDLPSAQPPHFSKYPLRPEQLRSLRWMLAQEETTAPYVEEEVAEAVLAPLGWRAEVRAHRRTLVRGGIVADQVGYGKTAITLGLIDATRAAALASQPKVANTPITVVDGRVPVGATLVISPGHLMGQWPSEVAKFTGSHLSVLKVKTLADLNRLTVKEVAAADIVIVSVTVFRSKLYYRNLARLAGTQPLPEKPGRLFDTRYKEAMAGLRERVLQLHDGGAQAAWTSIVASAKAHNDAEAAARRAVASSGSAGAAKKGAAKGGSAAAAAKKPKLGEAKAASSNTIANSSPVVVGAKTSPAKTTKAAAGRKNGGLAAAEADVEDVVQADGSDELVTSAAPAQKKSAASKSAATLSEKRKRAPAADALVDEAADSEGDEAVVVKVNAAPTKRLKRAAAVAGSNDVAKADAKSVKGAKKVAAKKGNGGKKAKAGKSKGRAKAAAAMDESEAEESASESSESSEDEDDVSLVDEDEDALEEEPKPRRKSGASNSGTGGSGGGRSKAGEGGSGATSASKKAPTQAELDPWGLERGGRTLASMRAPPLELFAWNRLVIDEFTYIETSNDVDRTAVKRGLTAERRWCLSGTPPVSGFAGVKAMADFLGAHLGVDDAPAAYRKEEQTAAEQFQFFRNAHTPAWHARRHALAQEFLDRFVRQNVAEVDEIKFEETVVPLELPAAERALYLELDHHLQAMDMKAKKTIKGKREQDGDREARLRRVLGNSSCAEEALLKRCSHVDLEGGAKSAEHACHAIVTCRQGQLDECYEELGRRIADAFAMREKALGLDSRCLTENDYLDRFLKEFGVEAATGNGDSEAAEMIRKLVPSGEAKKGGKKAANGGGGGSNGSEAQSGKDGSKKPKKAKGSGGSGDGVSKAGQDAAWELREQVHLLNRLQRELVNRIRSLRFVKTVRDVQQGKLEQCPQCARAGKEVVAQAVLSCCGHSGCLACLTQGAELQSCIATGCTAPVRHSSIVEASTLGVADAGPADGLARKYGTKMAELIKLVKETPKKDRVLVFVQFPDLMKEVEAALNGAGITALKLAGGVHKSTAALSEFQKAEGGAKVLLLNLRDESASGANLTVANHVIFVHPLLADSQYEFESCETQAVGRARRYGQTKAVHFRRLIVLNTIDSTIYTQRVGQLAVAAA